GEGLSAIGSAGQLRRKPHEMANLWRSLGLFDQRVEVTSDHCTVTFPLARRSKANPPWPDVFDYQQAIPRPRVGRKTCRDLLLFCTLHDEEDIRHTLEWATESDESFVGQTVHECRVSRPLGLVVHRQGRLPRRPT